MIYLYTDFAKLDVMSLDHYHHFRLDLDFKKLVRITYTRFIQDSIPALTLMSLYLISLDIRQQEEYYTYLEEFNKMEINIETYFI